MNGDMKNEAGDSKKRDGKGTEKPNSAMTAPPAGSSVTPEQVIALYKDRLRALQYEQMQLERRLAAADRERMESATEAHAAGTRWSEELAALRRSLASQAAALETRLAQAMAEASEQAGIRLGAALDGTRAALKAHLEEQASRADVLADERHGALLDELRREGARASSVVMQRLDEVGTEFSKGMESMGETLREHFVSAQSQATATREEHAGLLRQIDRLTSLTKDLDERLASARDRERQLEHAFAGLRADLSTQEASNREQRRALDELRGLHEALSASYERVRSSRRFRLGDALVAARTWRGALALPGSVYALLKRPEAPRELPPPRDELLSEVAAGYAVAGVSAAADFAAGPFDAGLKAAVLTDFAKRLFPTDADAALEIGALAHGLEPADYRGKWLAFLTFEAGHVRRAAALLGRIGGREGWRASELARARQIEGCLRLLDLPPSIPRRAAAPAWEPIARRTLYVTASSLPHHQTGYTLRTQAICRALRRHGLDVRGVTRPGYPQDRADGAGVEPASTWEIDGVPYHGIAAKGRRLAPDEAINEAADALYALISQLRPAIVHAASNHENALPALIAARRAGIPFVYEVRGLWELTAASRVQGWEGRERGELGRALEALVAREADGLLTINGPVAEELASYGVPVGDAVQVPNAIDAALDEALPVVTPPAQLAGADFVVGYAGSLLAYEGLDDLVRAIAELRTRRPGARALIVGTGDAERELKALAETLGVSDHVAFVGKVTPSQARAYLSLCHCVAIPRKPFKVCDVVSPLKPVEAMSLGLPVVVSDVRALREMVDDGVTGLLHRAGDPVHLAGVLMGLASSPELAQRIGDAARDYVLGHRTWPAVTSTMLSMYDRLVGHSLVPVVATLEPEAALQELALPIPSVRNSMTADERDAFDQALAKVFETQGGTGVRRLVDLQAQDKSRRFFAFCAMRGARLLMDEGDDANAMVLAEAAVESSDDRSTLKGVATLFFNLGQDDRSVALVELMEARGEMDDSTRKLAAQIRGRQALLQLPVRARLPGAANGKPVVVNFLHFSLPYTSVGYATRSHGIAQGVLAAGWDIRPYTRLGFPQDFKPELEEVELPASDLIDGVRYGRVNGAGRRGMSEVDYLSQAADCYERVLVEQGATIVHAASNYTTALPALIAARRLGLPFVYEIRGFWEVTRSSRDSTFEKSRKYRAMKMYEDFVVSHADRIITITLAMKEELVERGVPAERISLAYNSVDVDRFHALRRDEALASRLGIPAGVPVIGYVGSFVDYEGLDDLLTAAATLRDAGRDFRLLMVGDGAAMPMLQEMVVQLRLESWVILTGRVPHEDVEAYYSLIDVAPFPRKPWEVCELVSPLKPFEAMAMKKPVVVSGTRALLEIVTDGLNGLVFEKGDPASLAKALGRLLDNPQLRADIGERARAWVEEYRSWKRAGTDVVAAYADALEPPTATQAGTD